MKTITKQLVAVAALAAALGGTARAGNVYLVGAQAARTAITPAIRAIPGIKLIGTSGASTNSADVDGAIFNLFQTSKGTFIGVNWVGGEAAVRALLATNAAFAKVPFISTNTAPGTVGIPTNSLLSDTSGVTASLLQPQIALANNGAAYSRFNGTTVKQFLPGSTIAIAQKYNKAAADTIVDVSTYGFAADRSWTNTGVKSITSAQARVLFKYGNAPLSLFTGNAADSNATVWLSGRDIDAGARVNIYNFTGYGGLNDTFNHRAYDYVTNGGVKSISAIGLWPAGQVDGIAQAAGNIGYAQGSDSIKNVYPLLSGTNLQYVTTGNKQVIAYQTNFTATNLVTNPLVGSNNSYTGALLTPVNPGTNVIYRIKTQGTLTSPAVFNGISYYVSSVSANINPTNTITKPPNGYLVTNSVNLTNSWTRTGANYLLTYESLVNIGNPKNTNNNGQLPILLSFEGVGADGAIASSSVTAAVATNHVVNGGYRAWNYDHLLLNSNGVADSDVIGVRDQIQSYLSNGVTLPNLKISDLKVTGGGDGSTAYPTGITIQ